MIKINQKIVPEFESILTTSALNFLTQLHRSFQKRRLELLQLRNEKAARLKNGETLTLLKETDSIRESSWAVASAPLDLIDRRTEITGPVEAKMMVNALNSGAKVFMADFEDSLSPTWDNVMRGQLNCYRAVRRELAFTSPEGKHYELKPSLATLVIRPRGWHLEEAHVTVDGEAISASLFDFGLYFFHNAKELIARGSGPYFYLPKMESHLEARLWNDVFNLAQDHLGIPRGTVRATVLIETLPAAFEMDEILFELKDHAAGLNAGRWDYIFSAIKKFSFSSDIDFPDRAQLTMTVPYMRAYTERLVRTCHRRGAHAIGGMAAFIPSRKDAEVNGTAFSKVREDKLREARDGFDGTWVAHPDLVPVALEVFTQELHGEVHQKSVKADAPLEPANLLLPRSIPGATITAAGFNSNISVALQYMTAWLNGQGAVGINNLMEDAATAEIARAELWHWVQNRACFADGRVVTPDYFKSELRFHRDLLPYQDSLEQAAVLLDHLVLSPEFEEFLTLPAYKTLIRNQTTIEKGVPREHYA